MPEPPLTLEDFIRRLSTLEAHASLTSKRQAYEALHARHRPRDPQGLRVDDDTLDGIPVRRFRPQAPDTGDVVYLHGGGWNLGSVRSHHGITANLAHRLGRTVVSVDYRLYPEATYREALADCRHVVDHLSPVALVGDSAGGRLAIDVAHASAWRGVLGLIYPVVGTPTEENLGPDAPLLTRADVLDLWTSIASHVPFTDADKPPVTRIEMLTVARDPLTRPAWDAVTAWREAGASVGYRCAPNLVHSALHAHAELPEMHAAWQDFCQALRARLDAP